MLGLWYNIQINCPSHWRLEEWDIRRGWGTDPFVMEVTSTVEFVPPTVFKVDLKEENRANEASGDVGDAEVQVHCSGVNIIQWIYSQVTIKEEKPEDMWPFKDVVVGEVNKYTAALETKENVLQQKN